MEGIRLGALATSSGSRDHHDSGMEQPREEEIARAFELRAFSGPYNRLHCLLDTIPVFPCQRQTAPSVQWLGEQSLVYV